MDGLPRVPPAVRRLADALLVLVACSLPLSTSGVQVGVIGLGVLSLLAVWRGWGVVRRSPLDGVLGVFYGTLAVSTLASLRPLEAAGWRNCWIVLAYFVVFWWTRSPAHVARLVRLIVAAGAVAGAYGILQHFTGADWYRQLLGRATQVAPRTPGARGFAVVGFFRSYLTFGHAMIPPLAWAAAQTAHGRVTALVAASLLVIAIVFSTARGAWLAMGAAALVLVSMANARRAVVATVGLGALAAAALAASPDLRTQARLMFSLGGVNAPRLAIYRANLEIVHEHPLLGLGFGRYRTAGRPYYARHPEADRHSHAHNNYLHLAAEAGLAGLAAFMLVFAVTLRRGVAAVRAAGDPARRALAVGAVGAIVGFMVGGLTQYTFGDSEVATAMWVATAVIARLGADEDRA